METIERMDSNGLIHDMERLKELRALSLDQKIGISIARIIEWYQYYNGNVYIAFSGGKDSTVLLHLVRSVFPDVPAVFVNTGLEFPEVVNFVKTQENVIILRPEINFKKVLIDYGYPLISKEVAKKIRTARRITYFEDKKIPKAVRLHLMGKHPDHGISNMTDEEIINNKDHSSAYNSKKYLPIAEELPVLISEQCCNIMKKNPSKVFEKEKHVVPYIGTLVEESRLRQKTWLANGCNAFFVDRPKSTPLSFWTEQDILTYIKYNNLEIASCYGEIEEIKSNSCSENCKYRCSLEQRTGCTFCSFGQHLEKENKYQHLAKTHPQIYDFCMRGGQWIDNPKYDGNAPTGPDKFGWVNWNPKKIWVPSKEGLGFKKVFDMANELVPGYIKYE